jgi:hypothetical protein
VTTLSVFWPEAQYQAVIARWPHLTEHLGATWNEHRQRTERPCALVDREGLRVNQLPADVADFKAFLAGRSVTTPDEDDLRAYPDLRDVSVGWCSGRRTGRLRAGADRGGGTSSAAAGTAWAPWPDARPYPSGLCPMVK